MTAEKDVQVARKKTFFLHEVFPNLFYTKHRKNCECCPVNCQDRKIFRNPGAQLSVSQM